MRRLRMRLLPLVYLLWLVVPGLGTDTRSEGAALGLMLAPSLACASAVRGARRRPTLALWLLAAGSFAWAGGNLVSIGYVALLGKAVPVPSAADAFYLLFVPLLITLLLTLPIRGFGALGRLRVLFDGLVAGVGFLAVVWPLVLRPIVDRHNELPQTLVACTYTAGDMVLLAVLLPLTLGASPQWRPTMLRLDAMLLLCASSDITFSVSTGLQSNDGVPLASFGWLAAFCIVPSIVRHWPTATAASPDRPDRLRATRARRGVLAMVTHLPALAGTLVAFTFLLLDRLDVVTGVAVVGVVVLGVVRQQFAFHETEELTSELESRVEQRTAQLAVLAYTDPLTGLSNRARFHQRLEELSPSSRPVLLLLDLDGFKSINDTLGHITGDELLELTAVRLRRVCPDADVLARLGGDEFAVLLVGSTVEQATRLADRLLDELAEPFTVNRGDVRLGGSIGIATGAPADGRADADADGVGDLLRQADLAMYAAKAAGRNRWREFDPQLASIAERRRDLEHDLRDALSNGQLSLAWQPIVDLADERIVGAETLLRWSHPKRGAVPPADFIPVAEETGAILTIGAWVLDEACAQAAAWSALLPAESMFSVSVNVSVHQLQPEFVELVRETLDRTGLRPDALILEVTEGVFLDDDHADPYVLQDLRRLGVRIYLDDFGTGYSSLGYLDRFPVDGLKIDRSFVAGLGAEGGDVISEAVLHIARSLRLAVVAEGIEERHQQEALLALGCPQGQGFGLGRPMPADALAARLGLSAPVPAPREEHVPVRG